MGTKQIGILFGQFDVPVGVSVLLKRKETDMF